MFLFVSDYHKNIQLLKTLLCDLVIMDDIFLFILGHHKSKSPLTSVWCFPSLLCKDHVAFTAVTHCS